MKWITFVILHNFMSYADARIELSSGINALLGESDKGKTTLLRGIKWVCRNEPRGNDFVRHGCNETHVTLGFSDGHEVTRARRKNKNIYEVKKPDGEILSFENFGINIPQEVLDATGMAKTVIDQDKEFWLNFAEQLDAPFLLSEPGSVRAKTIGSIVNTHLLDAAERDLNRDVLRVEANIKELDSEIKETEIKLQAFQDLNEQEKLLAELEGKIERLQKVSETSDRLKYLQTKLMAIEAEKETTRKTLAELKVVPKIERIYLLLMEKFRVRELVGLAHNKLTQRKKEIEESKQIIEALQNLPAVEDFIQSLDEMAQKRAKAASKHQQLQSLGIQIQAEKKTLDALKTLPAVTQAVQKLEHKMQVKNKAEGLHAGLKEAGKNIEIGKTYLEQVKVEREGAISEYVESLKQLGKCPTCMNPMDPTHMHHIENELREAK